MIFLAILIVAELALFAALVILREPKLIIPAVVLGLPIEYFGTQALGFLPEGGIGGALRALLNPGKAAMLAAIGIAVVRHRHEPRRLIANSSVVIPVLAILALFILGVAWSDDYRHPENSILILPMYVAFVIVAPSLIEDRRDVERIVGSFLLIAAFLGALAVAQRVLGIFNWRDILIASDEYTYRSNATYADPNNLARFLAISMSLAAGLILSTGPRRQTVYLAIPMLGASALGIVATASRSGWILLVLATFLIVLVSPIARYTKARITVLSAASFAMLLSLLLAQGGTDAERIKSLSSGVQVIGQREFLIRAGWAMFTDNPLVGVGSGNYQHSLLTNYAQYVPRWTKTSLSHTSLVSLLAELGFVGLATLAFASVRILITTVRTYRSTTIPYNRLITGWVGVSLFGIFLVSQSEGRLFDEPYLWFFLALLAALETSPGFRQSAGEESPSAPAAVSPGAPPTTSPAAATLRPATE